MFKDSLLGFQRTVSVRSVAFNASSHIASLLLPLSLIGYASLSAAQMTNQSHVLTQLTQSAWQKQADSQTLASQAELLRLKAQTNARSTPDAGSIELGANRGAQGSRAVELAYTTALWLRGERSLNEQLLLAESQLLDAKIAVSKWRTAGQVRETYWAWRLANSDVAFAKTHSDQLAALLNDVKKRQLAGELSAADVKQAEIAHFSSLSALAEAQLNSRASFAKLEALTDAVKNLRPLEAADSESSPHYSSVHSSATATHPVLSAMTLQLAQLGLAKQLAVTQAKSRPELTLGAARDKGAVGEAYQSNVRVGLKIPLGSTDSRQLAQQSAQVRIDELHAEHALEAQRLKSDQLIAGYRLQTVTEQVAIAQSRSDASEALLGMIQKAFAFGDLDLPTRIRAANEANEAKRLLAKAVLEKNAAISSYQQAFGLLP